MIVAAAGPISNMLQACAGALILHGLLRVSDPQLFETGARYGLVAETILIFVRTNLVLAFFNLIPVPPLDGGNVLLGLLPPRLAYSVGRLREFGFVVLYALMFTGFVSAWIVPPTNFFARILLP